METWEPTTRGEGGVWVWSHLILSPQKVQSLQAPPTSTANEESLEIDWGGDLDGGLEAAGEEALGLDTSNFEIIVEESGTREETAG